MQQSTKPISEPGRWPGVWSADKGSAEATPETAGNPVAAEDHIHVVWEEAATETPVAVKTVLVVDDEPLIRELIVQILRQEGYQVMAAADAREARQLTQTNRNINLLLTDFAMPVTNGLELARWFQKNHPDMKVLITTGSLWELANQIGAQERVAILPKPFDHSQLNRMVRLVLE